MSATFEIYDDQNEEKSCEYPESLLSLTDKPKISPLEERDIPIGIPFIKEAKLETLKEIKEKEREEYFSYDGEHKEQECYREDEGGSPAGKDMWLGQSCIDPICGMKNGYNYRLSSPKLIQTSCLSENEVEEILSHLLELIYAPSINQAYNWGTNFEEKLDCNESNRETFIHLKTQMGLRLQEGHGEAKYIVGVGNNCDLLGLNKQRMFYSLKTLCQAASSLKADILLLDIQEGSQGKVVQVLVRSACRDVMNPDIKVMLLGDTQSGKSTLVGLLTSSQTDDGNGSLRENVHSHRHEIISGETASLNFHIIAFENNGNTQNLKDCEETNWQKTVESGAKVFTFIDVGGHEKHKQKVYSALTSVYPDYIVLVVSAAQGVTAMMEHHLQLALLSELPVIIVITHRDVMTENQLYELKLKIESSIRRFSEDHYLVLAENSEDNLILSRTIKQKVVIPMFAISSVNRTNVNLFKSFLALLPVNNILTSNFDLPPEFHAYSTLIRENQIILTGIVLKGMIKKHQILLFGPDNKENFKYVEVLNIRSKGVLVRHAGAGQICTVEIKVGKFTQQWLNSEPDKTVKGLMLIDPKSKPELSSEFVAEVSLLQSQSSAVTFYEGYEPVIITQSIKQACHLNFEALELQETSEQSLTYSNKENCASKMNDSNVDYLFTPGNNSKTKSIESLDVPKKVHAKSYKNKLLESSAQSKTFMDTNNSKATKGKNMQSKTQMDETTNRTFRSVKATKGANNQKKHSLRKTSPEDLTMSPRKKEGRFVVIQPGETKLLTFRFKFHAEYLVPGQKVVIDDTCVKCVGTVKKVLHTTVTPRT